MTAPVCANCARPSPDGAPICASCADALRCSLRNIATFFADLDTVRARQTRYGSGNAGRRSRETPVFFDPRVRETEWVARNTLTGWVRVIADQHNAILPHNAVGTECAWLIAHVEWLRHHEAAVEAYDELTDLEAHLRRLVDRPPERIYSGPCTALVPVEDAQ